MGTTNVDIQAKILQYGKTLSMGSGTWKMFDLIGDGTTSTFTLNHMFGIQDKDGFVANSVKYVTPDTEGQFVLLPIIGIDLNNATVSFELANIPPVGTSYKVYLMAGGVSGGGDASNKLDKTAEDNKLYGFKNNEPEEIYSITEIDNKFDVIIDNLEEIEQDLTDILGV